MILKDRTLTSTPIVLAGAEKYILEQTNGDEVLWLGRAASALIMAYKTIIKIRIDVKGPEVILPAMSCSTPSNTALMCGLSPRYADIDMESGLTNLEYIKKRHTPNTVAVLFIHLFGNTSDLREIKEWCETKQILLIEDNAQSLGAKLENGKHCGASGDFVLYSFNKTKIIESGGGALVIRKSDHLKVLKDICKNNLPPEYSDTNTLFQLSLSYRNLHHSLVSLFRMRCPVNISKAFLLVRDVYDPLYFKTIFDSNKLALSFEKIDELLNDRIVKAKIYKTILSESKGILALDKWETSQCCWRFTFLLQNEEKLFEFSENMRNKKFHISNLYWPVNQFFKPADDCPNADYFGRRVINTWVDPSVDLDWVKNCARELSNQLSSI